MRRWVWLFLLVTATFRAQAHVGSPDIFYDGMVGPYPARITIRVPSVVPGRAEISARVQSDQPVELSFLPIYSATAISNAPPPDTGKLVTGETNLYAGELWLMSFGAYSVEVRIKGDKGEGKAQIPVTSVALKQLPLPSALGKILLLMASVLVAGGIAIAAAAGRDAALPNGAAPGTKEMRRGQVAAILAAAIFTGALAGGRFWWNVEETAFRRHLHEGAWPDLTTSVLVKGSDRILHLQVGSVSLRGNNNAYLIPDHGKLMHLFLIREGERDAFAHLHPIRNKKDGHAFDVVLPPLPEGRYTIFCDLTFEGGVSSTAMSSVTLPAIPPATQEAGTNLEHDADDSWAEHAPATSTPVYRLASGEQIAWHAPEHLRTRQDASLRFTVKDAKGEPISLEPYMGMLCHAAVLRKDGTVFAHLHPSGNYSMAAQNFFENKLAKEAGDATTGGIDHSKMHHHSGSGVSTVYLPYEFPEPGEYRIWVQFKVGERVVTAAFDAQVGT